MRERTTQGEWFTHFSSSQRLWTIQVIRGWLFRQAGKCDTVGEKEAARFDAEHIAASHNARLSAVVLRLLNENERLRKALLRFGSHYGWCDFIQLNKECSCGWNSLKRQLENANG